jgi:acetyl-CoA acetyltransferase
MSRAPLVMPKATTAFSRNAEIFDSTIGWRFVNPLMEKMYGTASMPETAENVAETYGVDRASQDAFAWRSQQRAVAALRAGIFAQEIAAVNVPGTEETINVISEDEHLRPQTTLESLAKLPTPFRKNGTVTAGNASGINDGACALFLARKKQPPDLD